MSAPILTDDHYDREIVKEGDAETAGIEWLYAPGESVGPKFAHVAAAILWQWSLDSLQDEECGDSEYGNGWNALFRDERAILNTNSQGFVYAWRVATDNDLDEYWQMIEAESCYPHGPEYDE